jgi:hypothetical protein
MGFARDLRGTLREKATEGAGRLDAGGGKAGAEAAKRGGGEAGVILGWRLERK